MTRAYYILHQYHRCMEPVLDGVHALYNIRNNATLSAAERHEALVKGERAFLRNLEVVNRFVKPDISEDNNFWFYWDYAQSVGAVKSVLLQQSLFANLEWIIDEANKLSLASASDTEFTYAAARLQDYNDYLLTQFGQINDVINLHLQAHRLGLHVTENARENSVAPVAPVVEPAPPVPEGIPADRTNRKQHMPQGEVDIKVREYLGRILPTEVMTITRDAIVKATGASAGSVSKSPAWKAFQEKRKELKPSAPRIIPQSIDVAAVIPRGEGDSHTLARLLQEQQADDADSSDQ
ncbi:MAG: hypothetical protein ACRCZF_07800, partial [Gemmataceae bacterium]